jgi:partitioning defective protein 6
MELKNKCGTQFCQFFSGKTKAWKICGVFRLPEHVHKKHNTEGLMGYADIYGDLLPINNNDNYHKAISTANLLLRIFI